MQFSQLSQFFEQIEHHSSRLEITRILSELFQKLAPEEIEKTAYLLQGRVVPLYEKVEFGMAEKTVIKAVVSALNIDKAYFSKEYKRFGDLGKTVEEFKKQYVSFEEREMSILEVFSSLDFLARSYGDGSIEKKVGILSSLIRQLDSRSCRFLVRIPLGVMRLGFSDMTILDAYSWMISQDKQHRKSIEAAYHVRPDLGFIGRILKERGIQSLHNIEPKLFTPIIMMRAERLSSGKEIINQIGECAVEPKYDGFRLQVHFYRKKNKIRLYSRNLEDVSVMYPDIVRAVQKEITAEELILEGEAIGYDPASGRLLPFQETVQRKRKYDIEEKAKEIPLRLFVFELLYKNGKSYMFEPFSVRRKELESSIMVSGDTKKDALILAPHSIVSEGEKIEHLFTEAVQKGYEGIIAKKLSGVYKPGAREWNWIKFKRSYSSRIEDTVDCVVMGYDLGKGKRTGFGIGAFLVGIYDEDADMFLTVSKIGTGLTDKEWIELKTRSNKSEVKTMPARYLVHKTMDCDVWLNPEIVVEIKADEITQSPVHTAQYALRFPRLVRFRDDKKPQDVTTKREYVTLHQSQTKNLHF